MAFEGHGAFPLTPAAVIAAAPEESGVYAIHTPTIWVFIGDSDNVRQALLDHLNAPDGLLDSFQPLSFSWEQVPQAGRGALRDALIAELRPANNGRRPLDALVPPRRRGVLSPRQLWHRRATMAPVVAIGLFVVYLGGVRALFEQLGVWVATSVELVRRAVGCP